VDAEGAPSAIVRLRVATADGRSGTSVLAAPDLDPLLDRVLPKSDVDVEAIVVDAGLFREAARRLANRGEAATAAVLVAGGATPGAAASVASALAATRAVLELEVVAARHDGSYELVELAWVDAGHLGRWAIPTEGDDGEVHVGRIDAGAVRRLLGDVLA
jgi:hypothetical protein